MKRVLILAVVFFFFFNGVSLTPIDEVQLLGTSLQQHWGYTEVYNNVSLFWWFSMKNPSTKPLIIWLGFYSTAETNFNQYGPITTNLEWRNNSLANDYNILFIDSIAGTGFSYVKHEDLYPHSTHETTYDILTCIKSIFQKFPAIEKSSSYIVADSFFAKIAPELAKLWHSIGSREAVKYNLKGLVIGNDPYFALQEKIWYNYEFMKKNAMFEKITEIVDEIDELRKKELWVEASLRLDYLFDYYFPNNQNRPQSLMFLTRKFVNQMMTFKNNDGLSDFMNDEIKNKLKLSSTWKIKQSVKLINNVMIQASKANMKSLYEDQLKTTNLKIVFLNTPMNLNTHFTTDTLSWVDDLDLQDKDRWDAQAKIPFTFNNKIRGIKKHYKNLHTYKIIQNLNSDFGTNANFLRTVFAEVMV